MKKIISICLATLMLFTGAAAIAADNTASDTATHRAVLLIYNAEDKLTGVKTLTAEDGMFDHGVVPQYMGTKRKLYFIDTQEIVTVQSPDGAVPEDTKIADPMASGSPATTESPMVTDAPISTDAPTATATPKATKLPSDYPAVYEKPMDAILSPIMVKDVTESVDGDDDKYYSVTALYMGKETKIRINDDVMIETAPDAYADMAGKNAASLEAGDIISLTANIAGTEVKHLYFICRPTEENVATSSVNYGNSFEKLFSSNGEVANQWGVLEYGLKATDNRYQYAFGIVGKRNGNTLTLINKDGDIDTGIEADMTDGTIVCVCDTEPRDYDIYVGDKSDVAGTIPDSILNKGSVELTDEYSYNYALVRIVDGTATDVMLFTNYNN